MKKMLLILSLACCLGLTGCSWFRGSYVSVSPHQVSHQDVQSGTLAASNYPELLAALRQMVSENVTSAPILVADYRLGSVRRGMDAAVETVKTADPLGAYAVEEIRYEQGTSGGVPAVAVEITYRHGQAQLQRLRHVKDMDEALGQMAAALDNCDAGVVMYVEDYDLLDFTQAVEDYAALHPETVMELPQVTEVLYGTGGSRVVELAFSYQTSRESLRAMRQQVEPVFESAGLYVGGSAPRQKFAQLYSFLMERFDYTLETSITPSYSLLLHGVGDSRAFATVYAAMCRQAGLSCQVVTGTRDGQPHTWNLVQDGDKYYHVDLLRCHQEGQYRQCRDGEMAGYVWDYSAYPQSPSQPTEPQAEEAEGEKDF